MNTQDLSTNCTNYTNPPSGEVGAEPRVPSSKTIGEEVIREICGPSPKFSVVIPLYNKAKSIQSTVESVLSQTFADFELLIVNDGSTDGSADIVRAVKDPRVRLIDKPNGGVSSARNRGIAEAKGEWIALLDGDDLWLSTHLENLSRAISGYSSVNVFYTGFTTDLAKNFIPAFTEFAREEKDGFAAALKGRGIWTSCVCFRSSIQKKMSMFREDLTNGEDWELWHRFIKNEKIVFVSAITAIYRTKAEARACRHFGNPEKRYLWHVTVRDLQGSEKEFFAKSYMSLLVTLFPFSPILFFRTAKRQKFLNISMFPVFFLEHHVSRVFRFFKKALKK